MESSSKVDQYTLAANLSPETKLTLNKVCAHQRTKQDTSYTGSKKLKWDLNLL